MDTNFAFQGEMSDEDEEEEDESLTGNIDTDPDMDTSSAYEGNTTVEYEVENDEEDTSDYDNLEYDYELHDNVAIDIVKYSRSRQAKNEPQLLLMTLGYLSGLMENPSHFVSGVAIGTSSSGKSHMQKQVDDLFPLDWLYKTTTGSDKSIIYDDSWEEKYIASMDELNKPSKELIEVLKGLHGDDEEFNYSVTGDGDGADRDVDKITRTSMPYWFLYAQFDPDFELWNRLLKIPVHEGKAKNEAVLKMQFDHHNIEFSDSEHVYDFDFTDGTEALRQHIRNLPKDAWVKLPAGEEEYGWDVAEVVRPIFDVQRSETNRVGAMVANLIRASALLNHHNREKRTIDVPNEGIKDAIVAEPEDVANVLACREVLLASTHEVDRKKMAICEALEETGGKRGKSSIADITEFIEDSSMPKLKRDQIEAMLGDMEDNHLVERYERAGDNGETMFSFLGWHSFGRIEVDEAFQELFRGVKDPIEQDSFIESMRMQNKELQPGATDFKDNTNVTSGGQTQLGGKTLDVDLEEHERVVYEAMKVTIDGERLTNLDEDDVTLYEMCGAVEMGGDPEEADLKGTLFDPEQPHWYQDGRPDDWVETEQDAFAEVDEAMSKLHSEGVMETEVHETKKGSPVEMTITFNDI